LVDNFAIETGVSVMNYRLMGKTGLKVSELCLGAMTFGRETSEPDSWAILNHFVAAGGNFIDTADVYTQGASEEILGRWLKTQPRADLVIASKVRFGTGAPTMWASAANTFWRASKTACAASTPITSTSTRCTAGTK
jgi:aryl-alcohol dehydrogenase-like predicted oxidoreductase